MTVFPLLSWPTCVCYNVLDVEVRRAAFNGHFSWFIPRSLWCAPRVQTGWCGRNANHHFTIQNIENFHKNVAFNFNFSDTFLYIYRVRKRFPFVVIVLLHNIYQAETTAIHFTITYVAFIESSKMSKCILATRDSSSKLNIIPDSETSTVTVHWCYLVRICFILACFPISPVWWGNHTPIVHNIMTTDVWWK